jgi:hypothetical protein
MRKVNLQKKKHPAQSRLNVSPINRCIGKVGHVSKLGLAAVNWVFALFAPNPIHLASFPHSKSVR